MGIKVSYPTRLILLLLMNMIKDSQITQSDKFAISLQRLKKEVRNGGRFWHAVGIILFGGSGQTCPKYPEQEVGNTFAIY